MFVIKVLFFVKFVFMVKLCCLKSMIINDVVVIWRSVVSIIISMKERENWGSFS